MTEDPDNPSIRALALTAVVAVVVWRAVALVLHAKSAETSLSIQALLALVGMTFLVCGLVVFLRLPGRASVLFMAYCICSGLHWGGPLELAAGDLRTGLLLFYLLVSGILGAVLLLHLALVFPRPSRLAGRRAFLGATYLPAVLAGVLACTFLLAPADSGLRSSAQGGFLVTHAVVTNLFSIVALLFFMSHLFRTGLATEQKRYVALVVAGMLVAWLPYTVASSMGVTNTDPWNLTVPALPLALALALFGIRSAVEAPS